MIFPKIEVAWSLVFNDTGLDEMKDLQERFVALIERFGVIHQLPINLRKLGELTGPYARSEEIIRGVPCRLYVKFNKEEMHVDCFAIKAEPIQCVTQEEHDKTLFHEDIE